MKKIVLVSLIALTFAVTSCTEKKKEETPKKEEEKTAPVVVNFNKESLMRLGSGVTIGALLGQKTDHR